MSPTEQFISRLEDLQEGKRSVLRRLAGQPLNSMLAGFDLFTGLWWPLRQASPVAPRRETSWLICKLYGAYPIPHLCSGDDASKRTLGGLLGCLEPRDGHDQQRFRRRFEALLCSALPEIEPHLRWALRAIVTGIKRDQVPTPHLDWTALLDDLSLWDRRYNPQDTRQESRLDLHRACFACRESHRTPQDLWACEYLWRTNHQIQGARHADRNPHDSKPHPVEPQPR